MNINPEALQSLYEACKGVLDPKKDEELAEIQVRKAVDLAEGKLCAKGQDHKEVTKKLKII